MTEQTQRDAFWDRIYDLAKENRDIIVVSADMGAPSLDKFRRDLPGQFVNVGIAEQNGIVIAAGLAMTGKHPFVYAIAPFVTLRCLEQIRVESGIMNIPITIVGVGAGFGYEDSGPTHHLTEDIAIMRAMPHIVINSISDNFMARAIAEMSCSMPVTNYVRLDRKHLPALYDSSTDFSSGIKMLRDGEDLCIAATGYMVHIAVELADSLKEKNLSVKVLDIFNIPINDSLLVEQISNTKCLVTLEEHFLAGGLGSAICEVISDAGIMMPIKRMGLPLEKAYCYKYGGREEIHKYYGINKNSLKNQIIQFVASCSKREFAFNK